MSIEKCIIECKLCGDLPKLSCNSMKFGKSKILVLGESPAKDGWIESGKAFYNKDGKLQASGRVLDRLLGLCGLSIDDINFTECCKCVISNRNLLRTCMQNCKPILFKQINKFDFDTILTMGQYPTEVVLGVKVDRLKDFVGREFYVDFGGGEKKVIPIYHTSPASPLCYKGNEEIFKKLI